MFRSNLLAITILVLSLLVAEPVSSQVSAPSGQLVLEATETLHLYSLNTDGSTEQIYNFEDKYALEGDAEWIIPSAESIVISPQSKNIAFIATNDSSETALFWLNINQPIVHQISIPGLGGIHWSPDGSAILMVPNQDFNYDSMPLTETYLYLLTTDTLSPVRASRTQ